MQQLNYFDSLFPPTTLYGHLIYEGKQKKLGVTVLTLYAKTNVSTVPQDEAHCNIKITTLSQMYSPHIHRRDVNFYVIESSLDAR